MRERTPSTRQDRDEPAVRLQGAGRAERYRDKLGLPRTRGSGGFVGSMLVDACGTGLFIPFSLIYFASVGNIPLATIGLALSVGRIVSIPAGFVGGLVVDRLGLKPVAATSMFLRSAAYCGYLAVDSTGGLITAVVFAAACDKLYWSAHPVIVASIADPSERDRWFGLVDSIRNLGIGLGAVASGVMMFGLSDSGLRYVVVANALSFALAGLCLLFQPIAPRTRNGKARGSGGIRAAAHDRELLVLLLAKTQLCIALIAVPSIVPLYIVETLDGQSWLPAAVFVVNCGMVVLLQGPTVRLTEARPRTRTVRTGAALIAIGAVLFLLLDSVPVGWALVGCATVAMVVFTLGELTVCPASDALALSIAPTGSEGTYTATYNLSWSAAFIVAPLMSTALLSAGAAYLWSVLAVMVAVSYGLVSWLHTRERVRRANHAQTGAGSEAERGDETP